jgi:hypothetical protein
MNTAACIVERTYGVELNVVHGGTKFHGTTKTIENREKYLRSRLKPAFRGTGMHGGFSLHRTEQGATIRHSFCVGGQMLFGSNDVFGANVSLPDQPLDGLEGIFGSLGDALGAYSGRFLPSSIAARLHEVQFRAKCISWWPRPSDMTLEEAQLPVICRDAEGQRSPFQPECFGWLNYWSSDVCKYVSFPYNASSNDRLHCRRTPTNAWLVRLGDEPLQPVDEHMKLLREMYTAFPKVGERYFDTASEQAGQDLADNPARSSFQ